MFFLFCGFVVCGISITIINQNMPFTCCAVHIKLRESAMVCIEFDIVLVVPNVLWNISDNFAQLNWATSHLPESAMIILNLDRRHCFCFQFLNARTEMCKAELPYIHSGFEKKGRTCTRQVGKGLVQFYSPTGTPSLRQVFSFPNHLCSFSIFWIGDHAGSE